MNPRDTLGYRIGLLARRWRHEVDAAVKQLDMTEATWRPLLHLSHLGEAVRQKDLAESMGIEGSTLVRLLDNLEERELILRSDGEDRRCKMVTLTEQGRIAMERARRQVTTLEHRLLAGLNDSEARQLLDFMDRIDESMAQEKTNRTTNP